MKINSPKQNLKDVEEEENPAEEVEKDAEAFMTEIQNNHHHHEKAHENEDG